MGIKEFKDERNRFYRQDSTRKQYIEQEEARCREAVTLRVRTGREVFAIGKQAIKGAFRTEVAVQEPPLDKGFSGTAYRRTVTTPYEAFLEGCEIAIRATDERSRSGSPRHSGLGKFFTTGIDLLVKTEGGEDVYAHVSRAAKPIEYAIEHPDPIEGLDEQVVSAFTFMRHIMDRQSETVL